MIRTLTQRALELVLLTDWPWALLAFAICIHLARSRWGL